MATFKTDDLIRGLNSVIDKAKEFLAISEETNKELKKTAKTIATVSNNLDVSSASGLQEFNKQLAKTNELVKIKTQNDKAAKEAEVELTKAEKDLTKEVQKETKAREEQNKVVTEEEKLRKKIAKAKSEEGKELAKLRVELNKINKEQRESAKAAAEQNDAYRELTRNTNEAQLNLKKLSAEYGVSSKEAKDARKEFEKLDNELREINETAKDGRRDVGRYKAEVKELADEMKGAANQAGGFGDVISAVTSPVGLASTAVGGLASAFNATEEGGNKVDDVLSQLKGGFNAVTSSVGGFVSSLIEGESVTEAYENNIEGVTERVKEQSQANLEATQAQRQNRIDLRTTSEELASLRGEYELLSQQAGDATTTLEAQNDAVIKQAEKAAEITDQELSVLDKQIEAIDLQIQAREGLNNQDLLDERQEFVNQQIELEGQLTAELATIGQERNQIQQDQWEQRLDFLFDASDRQKSITEKQIEDDSKSVEERLALFQELSKGIKETYAQIEQEFIDASGQQINIAEFANLEATEQAKLLETLNLSEIERNRLREAVVEYLQVVQDLDETQSDLNEVEEKSLSLQNEISIQRRKLANQDIELEKELTDLKKEELQNQIDDLDENSIERLEKEKELNNLLLKEQKDAQKKEDELKKKQEEEELKRAEAIAEERRRIIDAGAEFAKDTIDRIYEARTTAADNERDQAIRNQEIIQRGIEAGSELGEQSLAREKKVQAEREAEIRRLEAQALKLNALIALLQVWGNTGNLGETLAGFATVKTAASDIDGNFYEGTDSVGSTGSETKVHNGRDGFNAMLDEGEMVFNSNQSKELRGLGFTTRDSMLDLARMADVGVNKKTPIVAVNQDNSILLSEIKEQNKLLKELPNKMPIHNTGLTDDPRYIQEVIKKANVTSKLQRRAKGTWAR